MKRQNNKKIMGLGVITLLLLISVGYAFLQSNLRINGSTKISKSSWDVHFENIAPSTRGVSASTASTIDSSKTGINFAVNLNNLGDFYEFYVDVVNNGNFDAKLDSITTTNLTEDQLKYLDLEVTYSDGGAIEVGRAIRSTKKILLK